MKKQFTTALLMAAAITSAQAQVLKYDGGLENKPDTVNWYGGWSDNGGTLVFDSTDDGRNVVEIVVPGQVKDMVEKETEDGIDYEEVNVAGTGVGNDWERVLKFDGLQIKPNTIYRVKVVAKGDVTEAKDNNRVMQIAMMRGDENCDMPWVAEKLDGTDREEFRHNIASLDPYEYTTNTAMFYYTSDELQEKYYSKYNKDKAMPDNQFLRISFNGVGTFYLDDVVMEEAPIKGVYFNADVIKVDFGFPTNMAALVAASEDGTIVLDPSTVTVLVDGEETVPASVEIKKDGFYIFLDYELGDEAQVTVSFTNPGCGLTYSGALTPGNGKDVPSFTAEEGQYDETVVATSMLYEEPKLKSTTPADGSFELDGDIKEFSLTFNQEMVKADPARLTGNGVEEELTPEVDGKTITFKRPEGAADLPKGAYTVVVDAESLENVVGNSNTQRITIDFEVGKVQVAGTTYTDVESVGMIGENGTQTENWETYFDGKVRTEDGETRCFTFAEGGLFNKGFYLCRRGGSTAASITYGVKEGYDFSLPAGNVEITLFHSKWQGNGGTISYELVDANSGEMLAQGSAAAETSQADQGQVVDVTKTAIRLENFEGAEYCTLRVSSDEGWYGSIVFGFDVRTYVVSEGETADSEVAINENFASVGNGNRPGWGSGWNIYGDNGFLDKGGNGLSRIMSINNCDGLSQGYYNRFLGGTVENYCMTYGEPTRDDAPEGTEEPALELTTQKYNFSWMACNWKGESNTYYFAIYDADSWDPETLTGNPVYTREDVITANVQGNEKSAVAEKIDFNFTPAKAGRYILKWWMTGESVVGKIKIEKVGSQAVYWHNQLNAALAAAKDARSVYDDDRFHGTTRDAFDKEIAAAEDPSSYHTGAEYQALIDRLAACTKAMAARRDALNEYDAVIGNIGGLLDECEGTKFARLDAYGTLKALYEQYAESDPVEMEDEVLLPVQKGLTEGYNTLKEYKDNIIRLLTDQLATLAAGICKLDGDMHRHKTIIAVEDALTDDQALADELQRIYTYILYSKIAAGENLFETYDAEFDVTEDASIDLTGYIRNAKVYAVPLNTLDWAFPASSCESVFPGWTVSGSGNVNYGWGWGEPKATETRPIVDAGFKTPWASGDIEVSQTVVNLPVGVFNYVASTGDGAVDSNKEVGSRMFYQLAGEEEREEVSFVFNGEAGNRNAADCEMTEIEIAAGDNYMGTLTIGAVLSGRGGDGSATDFSQIDNFRLFMTAPAEGFDYAAAAKVLEGQLVAIDPVKERTDAPAAVTFYDLNGRRTSAPKGVSIKVERWADGYMRVSKALVK